MLMLFCIALGLVTALSLAATVYAYVQAKDGYEDETGFHSGVQVLAGAQSAGPQVNRRFRKIQRKSLAASARARANDVEAMPGSPARPKL